MEAAPAERRKEVEALLLRLCGGGGGRWKSCATRKPEELLHLPLFLDTPRTARLTDRNGEESTHPAEGSEEDARRERDSALLLHRRKDEDIRRVVDCNAPPGHRQLRIAA